MIIILFAPSASPQAPPPRWCPRCGPFRVGPCLGSAKRSRAPSASRRCWPAIRSMTGLSARAAIRDCRSLTCSCNFRFAFSFEPPSSIRVQTGNLHFCCRPPVHVSHSVGLSHLSEVKDEAVALVEAAPGQLHLLGTDVAFPFDLVQPLHRPAVLRLPEARLHASLLQKQKNPDPFTAKLCVFNVWLVMV